MKHLFLFIASTFLLVMAASAQKSDKLIVPAGNLQHIVLGEGMKVVLVNATEEDSQGLSSEVLQKLDVHFSGGKLELFPRRALEDQTVYVLVNNLQSISAGENTSVESDDILAGNRIDLYMDAGATARLKTKARVNAYATSDIDLNIKRTFLTTTAATGIN